MSSNSSLELAAVLLSPFGLPTPSQAEFVPGGLKHQLVRIETASDGTYALKLFSPRSTMTEASLHQLELAESVALKSSEAGVPSLVALKGLDGQFLQNTDGQWTALYPWVDGKTLPPTAALPERCFTIGHHLATLHFLKIRFPNQSQPAPEAFPPGHFRSIAEQARQINAPWASLLTESLEDLETINDLAMSAQLKLQKGWVTGHLDMDQKNVLWRDEYPTILDWESAKPIHPALEAMGTALNWSGLSAGDLQFNSFAAFFNGYASVCELEKSYLELAVDAVLGKWIIWLEFNLRRLLEKDIQGTSEEKIALSAATHALGAALKLNQDRPKYKDWLKRAANPK